MRTGRTGGGLAVGRTRRRARGLKGPVPRSHFTLERPDYSPHCGGFCILGLCMKHQWRLLSVRKKRPWCLSWRIQLDFSKRGTIDSSFSLISAAIEVFCKGQEYKTPHMVNQHQVCFLYFDNERVGSQLTMVFH